MKLGPHCLFGSADARPIVTEGLAPVLKCVDDWGLAELGELPHRPLVIGRKTQPFLPFDPARRFREEADPLVEARRFLYEMPDGSGVSLAGDIAANPRVQAWEGPNEPAFGGGDNPANQAAMAWYGQFEAERARLLHEDFGKAALVGNFATGNPDLPVSDRMAMWRQFLPALDAVRLWGGYLGLHEYWDPDWDPGNVTWHELRYRHLAEFLGGRMPRVVITECGWDGIPSITPGFPPGIPFHQSGRSLENYFASLVRYDTEIGADSFVVGACLFTFGTGWPAHNVEGTAMAGLLVRHGQSAPLPPGPGPGPELPAVPPALHPDSYLDLSAIALVLAPGDRVIRDASGNETGRTVKAGQCVWVYATGQQAGEWQDRAWIVPLSDASGLNIWHGAANDQLKYLLERPRGD